MNQRRTTFWLWAIVAPMLVGGAVAYVVLTRPQGPGGSQPPPVLGTLPEFSLTDQDGNRLGLKDLLGKAWVASFIFTRCQATCPAQVNNLALLQKDLRGSPLGDQTRLVCLTVDPDHDTPGVLREYAAQHGAARGIWFFLTGPADDLLALSRQGFKLPAARPGRADDPAAGPVHSAQLVLVDPWGQVRGYYDGTSAAALDGLRRDLARVLEEQGPTAPPVAESAALRDPTQALADLLHDASWLRRRQAEQVEEAKKWSVFHDFQFGDRLYDSGITFRHRIVDDAAGRYKQHHYDHGTGMAVADVDGDGRYDIFFVNQVGPCQLWRNLGGGKFEDITARAGVALPEPIKVAATFVDVNNDGCPDLYVTTVRGGNHLFLNDGTGHFTDVTAGSGLGLVGHYSAAVFFDYDRDGLVDLFLCEVGRYTTDTVLPVSPPGEPGLEVDSREYHYYEGYTDAFSGHLKPERFGKCRLLRNLGGAKFVDVTEEVGLHHTGWTGDATPIDVNGDGWPDLYVLNMQGDDEYYENQGGRRFVRKSREVFPKTPWGSMGVKVFDYNNDGKFDLLVTDMHSDMSWTIEPTRQEEKRKSRITWPQTFLRTDGTSIFGNALFENRGGGKFTDVSDEAGAETFWPWGPSVGDLNADGFQDVFITAGMGYPFRYGINSLLLNDGGKHFVDAEFVLGVEPRRGRRTAMPWFHLPAGASAPASPGVVGPVTVWGSLSSRSSVAFDLDDDGDLDIVTNEFNAPPLLLISNLSERKKIHFLKVRLVGGMTADAKAAAPAEGAKGPAAPGPRSNRDGLGAVVRVRCGTRNFYQVHDGKSGYLSQSSLPLYFGLGDAETVDEIEVTWPSGKRQTLPGPHAANKLVTVREP
jgi:cytochrome oxidase Cu insertion factor (SCO1/SenC/PrrC family)